MDFLITFDLRAPSIGAAASRLYAAALDMCAWADELGFDTVGLGEHHGAEDGYLPSPLVFAAAIAARTRRIEIRPSVLLAPFYDPVKLAEDLAVVQILSNGRLVVGIGSGYRPSEFEMFGRRREDRKRDTVDAIEFLRRAWTGDAFEWRGRTLRVTPVPDPAPPLLLGGSHPAVARRAARIADGYLPPNGENWDVYRDACREFGRPDPGATWKRMGPIFIHVTRSPDADWERIAPHIRHVVESYTEWTVEAYGRAAGPFAGGVDPADLRRSGTYCTLTPEQTVDLAGRLGPDRTFVLTPLLGGLDPDFAWQSLRLFEDEVWPRVRRLGSRAEQS